jgi:hypothetical protein
MNYITYFYPWNSRELKKIVVVLLKSWLVNNIKKLNYVHNYDMNENKIMKWEWQLIILSSKDEEKLTDFLSKNFPQIERLYLS